MKQAFLFVLFIVSFIANTTSAQDNDAKTGKRQLGISFSSFGYNDLVYSERLDGAASYHGKKFYTLGVSYLHPINKNIALETQIEFSHHIISMHPNVQPGMDNTPTEVFMSLVSIPVSARINFLRCFFINGGFFLDIDTGTSEQINSQGGLGALMGLGIRYDSDFRISVFVNPYFKVHSLIPFSNNARHQRLMESGFRFGLAYTL